MLRFCFVLSGFVGIFDGIGNCSDLIFFGNGGVYS